MFAGFIAHLSISILFLDSEHDFVSLDSLSALIWAIDSGFGMNLLMPTSSPFCASTALAFALMPTMC